MLIDSVPFHARLSARTHKAQDAVAAVSAGMYAAAYVPVRMELRALHDPQRWLVLLGWGVFLIVALEIAGRRLALRWKVQTDVEAEAEADPDAMTFLNIGPDAGRKVQPAI